MQQPELLAPAGGYAQLAAALRYGADAVYTGLAQYSLRAYADNFTLETLPQAVALAHGQGRKLYVTLNAFPWDEEFEGIVQAGQALERMGVDAAIVSDPGVIAALRAEAPGLPLHLSTQANTMNARAAAFWHAQGIRRIVLARELSLDRIAAMRSLLPETLELEAFVHGSMCVAYSGRCLLSAALMGRSANQGRCAQPCRWPWTLRAEGKTNEALGFEEDERGAYLLSASDLCMLRHLPALVKAGVTSFKIEGRMKNEYYVATVVSAYRQALEHPERAEALEGELAKASHRRMHTGFFFGVPEPAAGASGPTQAMEYIARVERIVPEGAVVTLKNRFFVGDSVEALTPSGTVPFRIHSMRRDGQPLESCGVPGTELILNVPEGVSPGDLLRAPTRNHLPNKPASSS